jgi:outer membrane protein OmpA-like peptidoglycan-associated protein
MKSVRHFQLSAALFVMAGAVVACGGNDRSAQTSSEAPQRFASVATAECVQLSPGSYEWDGTRFVATPMAFDADGLPSTGAASSALARQFSELDLPWLSHSLNGRVATLSGKAPDLRSRDRAFEAGSKIFRDTSQRADLIVVDAIQLGNSPGPGEGVAALISTGTTIRACQDAFNRTMQGRMIQFASDEARISPASATLLDALSGAAELCAPYAIEIGGHTDFAGSDDNNLELSQKRADAVRQYLINKGIDGRRMTARGFGESQPLDPAESQVARAKNRRTEFKVIERR